jgi:antitoxin component of MazEF toxin-antitoxin module
MGSIKTPIVRIGNSQGIRIPKALLEQCHLQGDRELVRRYGSCALIPPVSPGEKRILSA